MKPAFPCFCLHTRFFHWGLVIYFMTLNGFVHSQGSVSAAIRKFAADPALKAAGIGICVVDMETGKDLIVYNPDLALTPASTLKILSTATALGMLGGEFRIKTDLQYDGAIDAAGVLHGNLFLKGYGDPTLGAPDFESTPGLPQLMVRLALAVQQAGIRRITGYVVGDGTYFEMPAEADTWQWNDMGNYYAAGAWGLNIHENLYFLRFQQRPKVGDSPPVLLIEPEVPRLEVANEVRTAEAGTGDQVYIFGSPRNNYRIARGTIPKGAGRFTVKGALPDPPLFAARQLAGQLRRVGILSDKGPVNIIDLKQENKPRKTLYTHQSPPLKTIVERANMKSVNLYCEALLRIAGRARKGEGSLEKGLEAAQEFWSEKGLDFGQAFLEDGSGLSPRNAVNARFLAELLRHIALDQPVYAHFYPSLPVAGQSGTLKSTLAGTAAAGKIRAKTGTLERVRSLAGYMETRSGKQLTFCILVNNFSCKSAEMREKLEPLLMAIYQL